MIKLIALSLGVASSPVPSQHPPESVVVAVLHFAPALRQITANTKRLVELTSEAFRRGASVVVAPELATTGYSITAQEIRDSLGLKAPFDRLRALSSLARANHGYVVVGLAEIGSDDSLYNSAVMFLPDGNVTVQRKRGYLGWNTRGNLPFTSVATPFGRVGVVICSDTYLMDWPRILALGGADIVLTPANWWGNANQLELWRTRAAENGIALVVANRWGRERDTRYNTTPTDTGYVYDMNDAPSAVIVPTAALTGGPKDIGGRDVLVHRANEDIVPHDTVLLTRISTGHRKHPWPLAERSTSAYAAIRNLYYRPDRGNLSPPDLPAEGNVAVGVLAYTPSDKAARNLLVVDSLIGHQSPSPQIVLLPPSGIVGAVDSTRAGWRDQPPLRAAQRMVDDRHLSLLATSTDLLQNGHATSTGILAFRAGQPVTVFAAIHRWQSEKGSNTEPGLLDIGGLRVAMLVGRDALSPEAVLDVAKRGADILLSPYVHGRQLSLGTSWPSDLWLTLSNDGLHIVASGSDGRAIIVRNGGGFIDSVATVTADKTATGLAVSLAAHPVRSKFLNAYMDFDLDALLGPMTTLSRRNSTARLVGAPLRDALVSEVRQLEQDPNHNPRPILPPGLRPPR